MSIERLQTVQPINHHSVTVEFQHCTHSIYSQIAVCSTAHRLQLALAPEDISYPLLPGIEILAKVLSDEAVCMQQTILEPQRWLTFGLCEAYCCNNYYCACL